MFELSNLLFLLIGFVILVVVIFHIKIKIRTDDFCLFNWFYFKPTNSQYGYRWGVLIGILWWEICIHD